MDALPPPLLLLVLPCFLLTSLASASLDDGRTLNPL
jgi:hypothetical protein